MKKMKIGILGYGNLGKGVECAIKSNPDMELCAIYTRRNPDTITPLTEGVKVLSATALDEKQDIDVLILCGGSATDLPVQTPKYCAMYNVVDSFDNHSKIHEHFKKVDSIAKSSGTVATISVGWDPGLFSLSRAVFSSALPEGVNYTFWGKGVSQGHSDAIRRIEGVLDARQYTVPVDSALNRVRSGDTPDLTTREKHTRECFVVANENADLSRIENEIKTMPGYFADYDTTVTFVSKEELEKNHHGLPHGGTVIRTGKLGWDLDDKATCEFKLTLDSNPEFTSSILVSYARATYRLAEEGAYGCKTILDIPVAYASPIGGEDLIKSLL